MHFFIYCNHALLQLLPWKRQTIESVFHLLARSSVKCIVTVESSRTQITGGKYWVKLDLYPLKETPTFMGRYSSFSYSCAQQQYSRVHSYFFVNDFSFSVSDNMLFTLDGSTHQFTFSSNLPLFIFALSFPYPRCFKWSHSWFICRTKMNTRKAYKKTLEFFIFHFVWESPIHFYHMHRKTRQRAKSFWPNFTAGQPQSYAESYDLKPSEIFLSPAFRF